MVGLKDCVDIVIKQNKTIFQHTPGYNTEINHFVTQKPASPHFFKLVIDCQQKDGSKMTHYFHHQLW